MCSMSEGVSVWFACKLCKSFFLNADDFAYHKRKSHAQEFQSTKFIVFEEQTTPAASPPENWVSFLTPKEETLIHGIISSPLSPTTRTNVDYDIQNENFQSDRNEEGIESDVETNTVFILNDYDEGRADEDRGQVSNSVFELNYGFLSTTADNKAVNEEKNDSATVVQPNIDTASTTDYDLSDEKWDNQCSRVVESTITLQNKSSSLKRRLQNKFENVLSNDKNTLQTVIPSPNNPYILLKRLKLRSSADYKEVTPKVKVEPDVFWTSSGQSSSSATNLSISANLDDVCFANNNFNPYFDDDDAISNSSNTGNPVWEEEPINQVTDINSKGNEPRDPLSLDSKNHHLSHNNLISDPPLSTEDNLNYGDLLQVVKTEYNDGNDDSEFPGIEVDHVPLEFDHGVSADETRAIPKKRIVARSQSTQMVETFVCGLESSCADYFWTRKKDWVGHVIRHFPRLKCASVTCGFVERFTLSNYTHVLLHDYTGPWTAPSKISCPYCPYKKGSRESGLTHMMETHRAELCNRASREVPFQKYKVATSGVRKSRTPKGEHVYRIQPGRTLEETIQQLGLK